MVWVFVCELLALSTRCREAPSARIRATLCQKQPSISSAKPPRAVPSIVQHGSAWQEMYEKNVMFENIDPRYTMWRSLVQPENPMIRFSGVSPLAARLGLHPSIHINPPLTILT